jgi:hypothetical protein
MYEESEILFSRIAMREFVKIDFSYIIYVGNNEFFEVNNFEMTQIQLETCGTE